MTRKSFVPVQVVLSLAVNNRSHPAVFEPRPLRYMFGLKNYGEFVGWYNAADGDCFDCFAPGYAARLPFHTPYVVREIMGVLWLANGNHKIAIRVDAPGFDAAAAAEEIAQYTRRYPQNVGVSAWWEWAPGTAQRPRNAGRASAIRQRPPPPAGSRAHDQAAPRNMSGANARRK